MSTLLLRLAAPMQSWGTGSKFDVRMTEKEPSKSGVIGLLAASLGIRRGEAEKIKKLSELKFGVRVDKEGKMLHDFHMAHAEKSSYVTHRYYLCDAVFLCGMESTDDEVLEYYAEALRHPVFPLFLGRRSCPPTLPIVLGVRKCKLEEALKTEPCLCEDNGTARFIIESDVLDKTAAVVKDVPVSFNPRCREFGFRKCKEEICFKGMQAEHDPFAELEGQHVHDANGN